MSSKYKEKEVTTMQEVRAVHQLRAVDRGVEGNVLRGASFLIDGMARKQA
jgi:hypothetical protein